MKTAKVCLIAVTLLLCTSLDAFAQRTQPASRRSQRVRMEEVRIESPDCRIAFTLLPNAERLTFTVTRDDAVIIEPSTIVTKLDGFDLSAGVVLGRVERSRINETYSWHGVHSRAVNSCSTAKIALRHDLSLIDYTLEVRAYNDGVAFRHIIPGENGTLRVPDEYTTFVIPAGSTAWYHDLGGHYEAAYVKRDVADVPPGQWAAPPLTFHLPGDRGYTSLTEADLVHYSGMAFQADGRRGFTTALGHRHPLNYPFELRYGRDEGKRLAKPAALAGTITTPWRVVLVAADLNTLVNSDIVHNLCPPPDPKYFPQGIQTPWVHPGRAAWRYVDGGDGSFEGLKGFSRMAGDLGWEYHILEGVWSRWTDEQIADIVTTSKERGVRLLFWVHSNRLRTPEAQDAFFSRLHDLGVAGAKIDFFDHEAAEVVDLYEKLLTKAAQYQMVLNFHGANKPTGRNRTWPNELVREAVRGMESSSLRQRARHETILPFTRYLAGGADYTTMHFGDRRGDTTWAHQIASLAIFASPMLTIAAHPQSVLDNPAVDIIKTIPAVWDETIVLPPSAIGELAIFARRTGDTWFLAGMCGEDPATVSIPLLFLGEASCKAAIVKDNRQNAAAVVLQERTVQRTDTFDIEMDAGGGFLVRFSR
ncbi:MAG: glycoside hydrolase family 97 N-terminal domain-containing protein [Phycisphaerae bacterium]|nr:glycoside hydrolase family 97 N-terminal domain-containing protein [Phycisphaerae bacterium]